MSTLKEFIKLKYPLFLNEERNFEIMKGSGIFPRDVSKRKFSEHLKNSEFYKNFFYTLNRLMIIKNLKKHIDEIGSNQHVIAFFIPEKEYDDEAETDDNIYFILNIANQTVYVLPSGMVVDREAWLKIDEENVEIFKRAEELLFKENKRINKKSRKIPEKEDTEQLIKLIKSELEKKMFREKLAEEVNKLKENSLHFGVFSTKFLNNKEVFKVSIEEEKVYVKRVKTQKIYSFSKKKEGVK